MPFFRRSCAAAALTTAAAALACGAAPAHAVAITETTYDVTVEAKVTYGHAWHRDFDRGAFEEETTDAVATVKTTIEDVLFRDGKLMNPGHWGLGDVTVTGTGQRTRRFRATGDQLQTESFACTPDGLSTLGRTILDDNPDMLEPLGPGERLTVRITEGLRASMPCPGSYPMEIELADFAPFGQGLIDADFDLPGEAIGMGTIIQLIHSTPAQEAAERCPGRNDSTTRCAYSWEGTVRFDRTRHETFGSTPPAQQPTPKPADPPLAPLVPQGPPADDESDLLAPLVPVKTATLSPKGDRLSFRAACPAGCAGTLTLTTSGARAAAAAAAKGTKVRFTVKPSSKARTVTVKLPAAARKAVKRGRKVTAKVTLTPKGGTALTRTLAVTRGR
ncbi:MAG TPA: hypothetical protein VN238_09535 [Solirubrobacteraceae bacterium]|nr:hypothetical protein [Solirubrobacteraceae bacterium]